MPFSLYNHPRLIAYLYYQAVQPLGSTAYRPFRENDHAIDMEKSFSHCVKNYQIL